MFGNPVGDFMLVIVRHVSDRVWKDLERSGSRACRLNLAFL